MVQYTKNQMKKRFSDIRESGRYIIAAGAGSGLSAKSIEAGGADALLVFNSGKYRMQGHGSLSGWLAFGNANDVAVEMGEQYVLPVVKEVPVICSVFAQDVTKVIGYHLDKVKACGFSGINNFPTVGMIDGNFRRQLELTELGFEKEVEMVKLAVEKELYTMVYVFNEDEASRMAKAGADCIVAHVGLTTGGMIGTTSALTIEDSAELIRKIRDAGNAEKKDIVWLAHGGPLASPEDFAELVKIIPDIDGFVGASSMERIPTEKAISETVKKFREVK